MKTPKFSFGKIQINGKTVDIDKPLTMAMGNLLEVMNDARSVNAPIEGIPTYRDFAKFFRLPDGPMAGQTYNPGLDPIHDTVVRVLDSGKFTRHIWVGAVQTGKSLLMTLAMGRSVTFECEPVVYSQPTRPKIHEAWTGKILPVFEASDLAEWVPKRGQGSKGGQSPLFFVFQRPSTGVRAGLFYFLPGGGKSEAAQASVTAPKVMVDEVDSFPSRHRIELVSKRADSYGARATRIYTSTVKHDQDSIILGLLEDSTNSRLVFACPHCHGWQKLEWENVRYDADDDMSVSETARYHCPHCGVGWTEEDRLNALRNKNLIHGNQEITKDGKVIGDEPRTLSFGLLWTALDSTLRDISTVALEHYRAQKSLEAGNHGPMRSFYRDQLCRIYTGELEELETAGPLTWEYLMNRSVSSPFGPVAVQTDRNPEDPDRFLFSRRVCVPPTEAKWSVGVCDAQHNRVYWMIRAFDRKGTSWIYGWGYEYMRLDRAAGDEREIRDTLDRVDMLFNQLAGETDLVLCGLDVSDNTEILKDWVKTRPGKWRAMKGQIHNMASKPGDLDGLAWMRDGTLLFQSDNSRDLYHSTFRRPVKSEGTTLFPYGVGKQDVTIFRHMVSEQSGIDPETRRRILLYGPGRNDWLDCGKMSHVLILGFLALLRDTQRVEAIRAEAPTPSNVVVTDPPQHNIERPHPEELPAPPLGSPSGRIGGPIQQNRTQHEGRHRPAPEFGQRMRGTRGRNRW